ncbi:acyl-CoA dehydrogenase [Streptosporangium becharense]|uniref:Acyl-CoA dehydrogenase n=1 Tax=Streptosporangium becharense TaxID=1816182 RepID=A0A7W9MEC3_9ACTN|nr:acyl-CoA dehydrogenase family protein [Streptosporangium becharense]MBB2910620.1 acyl-CoA dehydrogenase [Streptosporangium becharense]MBB5817316.1 acyl-CoA dehydrogenase [Streptosporangium becharense]
MTHTPLELAEAVLPTLAGHAAEADRRSEFPRRSLAALRANGLMGLLVPREYGGLGGRLPDLVAVAQRLSTACLSTGLIWAMHCQQVAVLARFASADLAAALLPRIARGELYLASVTTEPGKGGHLMTGVAALADRDGTLLFEREAPVVTGGEYAEGFLITMRASEQARDNQLTLVYADRAQLDITHRGEWDAMGMRGTRSVSMALRAAVPDEQVVGEPGGFREIAVEVMAPYGHLAWASCWLGAATGALRDFVALVRSPRCPPSFDIRSDLVRERLARTRIDLEVTSAYLHRVCEEVAELSAASQSLDNPATQVHLNTLKVVAAEHTFDAVDRLVQLAGMSIGYRRGAVIPLERHFRDLRSASLNYADDRLLVATGALCVLDRAVRLA